MTRDPGIPAESEKPWRDRVAFRCGTRTIVIQVHALEWLEAQRDYVALHVGKEEYLVRATMAQMEADLDPRLFCRIHRSTIVNIDQVREVRTGPTGEPIVILQNGKMLALGRGYRERFFEPRRCRRG